MSIFRTVQQFFSAPPAPAARPDSSELLVTEPEQCNQPVSDWETTTGRVFHPQQERSITYHNSEINGVCTGNIGELTGSAMIGLFDDLPTWLPSLLIQVTIRADEGELTASLREIGGKIISIMAPGTLECNTELVNGRVWLRCESGAIPARCIQYEAIII